MALPTRCGPRIVGIVGCRITPVHQIVGDGPGQIADLVSLLMWMIQLGVPELTAPTRQTKHIQHHL
jgi:hypothetical protein